ncbi:MAG: YbaY family lipoprotein [Nevskiales bacterium]
MLQLKWLALPVLMLALLGACSSETPAVNQGSAAVEGEAFYLQKIALPKEAVLTVQLQDVSSPDAMAPAISTQRIELNGRQQPFEFQLRYEPANLQPNRIYAVSGRIEDSSGLRFMNTEQQQLLLTGALQRIRLKLDLVSPDSAAGQLLPSPEFVCRGNEPFWNLVLQGRKLQLSRLLDEVEEKTYQGGFSRYAAPEGAVGYEWQGEASSGRNSRLLADIRLEFCADSMAGPEEGGEFDYRIQMLVDEETLQGCCQLLEESAVEGASPDD